MPLSLYEATVPRWLQIIGALDALVTKAESWAAENDRAPADLIEAKLAEDMLPFSYQIKSVWTHSANAIAHAKEGVFQPDYSTPPDSFDGLRAKLAQAREGLEALDPGLLDSIADNPMVFEIPDRITMPFTVQNFLLGFTQPNFYFHATAAYAILRAEGLPIGKIDFMGAMPVSS